MKIYMFILCFIFAINTLAEGTPNPVALYKVTETNKETKEKVVSFVRLTSIFDSLLLKIIDEEVFDEEGNVTKEKFRNFYQANTKLIESKFLLRDLLLVRDEVLGFCAQNLPKEQLSAGGFESVTSSSYVISENSQIYICTQVYKNIGLVVTYGGFPFGIVNYKGPLSEGFETSVELLEYTR